MFARGLHPSACGLQSKEDRGNGLAGGASSALDVPRSDEEPFYMRLRPSLADRARVSSRAGGVHPLRRVGEQLRSSLKCSTVSLGIDRGAC